MKTICKKCRAISPAQAQKCHNCGSGLADCPECEGRKYTRQWSKRYGWTSANCPSCDGFGIVKGDSIQSMLTPTLPENTREHKTEVFENQR